MSALSYCQLLVRKRHYDIYASSIFLSHPWMRDFVWIWISLLEELEQLKDKSMQTNATVSTKLSLLKEAFNDSSKYNLPIPQAFNEWTRISAPYSVSTVHYRIKGLIKYYEEKHIPKKQFLSIEEMEEFGEIAYSGLFYCIDTSPRSNEIMHSLSHLGKSYGLIHFIKDFPKHIIQKQCYLPSQILFKHGFSQDSFTSQAKTGMDITWSNVIYEIASMSNAHLERAAPLDQSFLPFMIPLKMFLHRLKHADFNPLDSRLYPRSWHIRLLYNLFKQSFFK